jgi:hypothetical protein
MTDAPRLQIWLRSCLQAILELEPELKMLNLAEPLLAEFAVLKDIYERVETIFFKEDDVKRIENATAHFLEELKGSVKPDPHVHPGQRYIQ